MAMPGPLEARWRFADFEFDRDVGELRKGGARVALPDQPLHLLEILVEHAGTTVSRDQLRERLWPADTFVDFEHGLNAAVKRLRDALGDSADAPRFIETVPKRGYRFVAPVDGPPGRSRNTAGSPRIFLSSRSLAGVVLACAALLVAAGLVAWRWRGTQQSSGATVNRRLTRLTFDSGFQTDVTWSPDGRFIAYASDKSGNSDIWVQPADTGAAAQITRSPSADWQPVWSPDGRAIVFRSERDGGGLYVVPSLGGTEQRIAAFGTRPTWAPDGSQVLFGATEMAGWGILQKLYVVKLDGRPPRQVRQDVIDSLEDVRSWCWHPDSQRISVAAARRGTRDQRVFTVPLEDGPPVESRILVGEPETERVPEFQWAPDGAVIFVTIWLASNTSEVWRVTLDPQTLQQVRAERLLSSVGETNRPVVSPQGNRLAFGVKSTSLRLWSFPLDATAGRLAGDGEPVTDSGAWAGSFDLTPDGRTLVYDSTHLGASRSDLLMLDLETGTRRALTNDRHARGGVQWSRDGQKIAYLLMRAVDGATRPFESLVAVRGRDGDEEPLTSPLPTNFDSHDFILPFDWSPDGKAVLGSYDHPNQHFSLGLFPLAGAPHAEKVVTTLASDPRYNLWQGNYSPNGKWIAFVVAHRQQPGRTDIAVMPSSGADASGWATVTHSGPGVDKPRWSPDGRLLYFLGSPSSGGLVNVWALPFDPARGQPRGPAFQVTHFDSPSRQISPWMNTELSVSATRLVFPMLERTGSIWMLDQIDR